MNPHISFDLLFDLRELLAYPFMVDALQAGTLVAVMAAVVGWFMVLRRETFAGHTLSVMAFPGAGAAALASLPLSLGYFAFCSAGALVIAGTAKAGRDEAQRSAVIGTVQAVALAIGFLLLSLYGGVLENLESLLFGSIFGVTEAQVQTLLIVTLAVLLVLVAVGRPLLFASIDEGLARAGRVPTGALSVAFLLMLGLAVAATAQITGVLLVFALLAGPAATARQLTPRIGWGLALSVVIGLLTVWLGLSLSYFTNYPAGFFVTTIAIVLYTCARLLPVG